MRAIIEFFKPDRNKVIFTFVYPYLIALPLLLLFIWTNGMLSLLELIGIETLYLWLLFSLVSYPFICVLFLLYRRYKTKDLKRTLLSSKTIFSIVLVSFIISNPFSALFFARMGGFASSLIFYKTFSLEGVQVIDISPESPAAYTSGAFFGERIYSVEIYRGGERIFEKETNDPQDFYDVMGEVKVGDMIRLLSVAGLPTEFKVDKNFTEIGIVVQDIGEASLPLVEVVEVLPGSRFERTSLKSGKKIYEIEVYEEKITRIKTSYGSRAEVHRENLIRYRIKNGEDFYEVLDSVRPGETIMFKTTSVNHPGFLIEENITDWGIVVRDIELK